MMKPTYNYRYLAHIVIEAKTPLAVGSGENHVLTDSLVALDVNGLPYIPGTSIAGVLRHAVGKKLADSLFGHQKKGKEETGKGSEIIFTDAKMVGKGGVVMDGIQADLEQDDFYLHFSELPIRQHVRINHKGVAMKGGKFDEQVVFKGTRFCFEIEILSEDKTRGEDFETVMNKLKDETFRIGGGTRSGFGEIKICSLQTVELDLNKEADLTAYLSKSSDLNGQWDRWPKPTSTESRLSADFDKYVRKLMPDDFFLFGSGMGDEEADMTPVKCTYIHWDGNNPTFKTDAVLIPGASVKGALSHRVAFHYNRLTENFADGNAKRLKEFCGSNNTAVKELFGSEGQKKGNKTQGQQPGNVLISDVIKIKKVSQKLLNHVAIDRFTGGAIDGALFSEKVIYDKDKKEYEKSRTASAVSSKKVIDDKDKKEEYEIIIYVRKKDYSEHVIPAFEQALQDICCGMLPLGGGVNRGHGCFSEVE